MHVRQLMGINYLATAAPTRHPCAAESSCRPLYLVRRCRWLAACRPEGPSARLSALPHAQYRCTGDPNASSTQQLSSASVMDASTPANTTTATASCAAPTRDKARTATHFFVRMLASARNSGTASHTRAAVDPLGALLGRPSAGHCPDADSYPFPQPCLSASTRPSAPSAASAPGKASLLARVKLLRASITLVPLAAPPFAHCWQRPFARNVWCHLPIH